MFINTDSMREFIGNHESSSSKIENLDNAVLSYKQRLKENLESSAEFSSIVNKVLGVISSQAKKLNNPEFTESDAFSHGVEVLVESIDKWTPTLIDKEGKTKHVSFLTYFYRTIHNKFDTLAYRSKQYRSYLISKHCKNNETQDSSVNTYPETSLENLIDTKGESAYSDMPSIFIKQTDCSIDSRMFSNRPLAQKIINFIVNNNVTSRPEIANSLEIDIKQLNAEIRFIKKYMLKKLV